MTWSADEEYRARVLSRRRSVLRLRHPGAAYGPAAMAIMYAAGALAMLWGATGFTSASGEAAIALMAPAGLATAASAMVVGVRMRDCAESSATAMILRVASVWALVGAMSAALPLAPGILDAAGDGFSELSRSLLESATVMIAGALTGAFGGAIGGVAATVLCVERRS